MTNRPIWQGFDEADGARHYVARVGMFLLHVLDFGRAFVEWWVYDETQRRVVSIGLRRVR
jgi:hypothetical protein